MNTKDLQKVLKQSPLVAELFKTLSHPKRLQILCFLSMQEHTVGELEQMTQCSQSQVSQFLKSLESEGLVSKVIDGKFRRYQLKDQNIKKLMNALYEIYCQ